MMKRIIIWASFCSMLILSYYSKSVSFDLSETDHFVIGDATAKGVSISKRIQFFYSYIGIFTGLFILFFFLLKRFSKQFSQHKFIEKIDALSLFGLLLGVLSLFNPQLVESAQVIGFICLLIFGFGNLKKRNESFYQDETWMWVGMVFLSIYLLSHSGLISSLSTIALGFLLHYLSIHNQLSKFIYGIVITLPLLSFLGTETTLILNQRHVFIQSYFYVFVFWIILFSFILYWVIQSKKHNLCRFTYSFLIPITLIGMGLMQHYSPIFVQSEELFETANMVNPVMQYFQFGEIPIIDNLSSHLVSDYFWPAIYAALNGYSSDGSILLYSEFHMILYYLAVYYFLKSVFGLKPWILPVLIFLPAITFIIPLYYSLALVPLTLLYRFWQTAERKIFFLFILSSIFLVIWRLDIGISLIASILLIVPIWFYFRKNDRKIILIGLASTGIIALGATILFALNYPLEFSQLLGYFGANQAHALSQLTNNTNAVFYLHYFILPLIISGIALHTIVTYKKSPQQAMELLILTLSFFYIFNLQRGLVRHSFAEQNDIQIASFAWLIIGLKWWSLSNKTQSISIRNTTLMLASSLCALFFSYNASKGIENLFQKKLRFDAFNLPELSKKKLLRIHENFILGEKINPLISFIKSELKPGETFLDFSNSPTLYYYTGKDVPSYFNQYLQNTVTEKLQFQNIEDLKGKQVPLVVFSKVEEAYFDNVDDIPNKVRHSILTHYIYKYYEPYTQLGAYKIWRKKQTRLRKKVNPYPITNEIWDLGLITYFWKQSEFITFNGSKTPNPSFDNNTKSFYWKQRLQPNDFLELTLHSKQEQQFFISSERFQLEWSLKTGTHVYHIPLGCSENLIKDSVILNTYAPYSDVEVKAYRFVNSKKK